MLLDFWDKAGLNFVQILAKNSENKQPTSEH